MADGFAGSAARDLGRGWKVNPFIRIPAGESFTIADVEGPGCIQHIWLTPTGRWRDTILRIYWDGREFPAVECPIGDFFASGWNEFGQISSLAVCVNPGSAFNCYWPIFVVRTRPSLLGSASSKKSTPSMPIPVKSP